MQRIRLVQFTVLLSKRCRHLILFTENEGHAQHGLPKNIERSVSQRLSPPNRPPRLTHAVNGKPGLAPV